MDPVTKLLGTHCNKAPEQPAPGLPFGESQLVVQRKGYRRLHAVVAEMGPQSWSQSMLIRYSSDEGLYHQLAERWQSATYSSRRACELGCCKDWNDQSFSQRWATRNILNLPGQQD